MKRDIVTITLNPSIDVTLWVDGLDGDKVNRVQKERREAGGKGVNVARVTGDFGLHTCCIVVAGKDNADELHRYLDDEDLLCDMLRVDGAVRENLTLRCGSETVKINRQGPTLYSKMGAVLPAWLSERISAAWVRETVGWSSTTSAVDCRPTMFSQWVSGMRRPSSRFRYAQISAVWRTPSSERIAVSRMSRASTGST